MKSEWDQMLNTHAAAARVGLSYSTLTKYRLTGAGPRYRKLGRAVRYLESDLVAWLDAMARLSTSERPGE